MSRLAERPLDGRGLPEGYPLQADWEVTPREVRAMRESGDPFILLDVREPREVEAATLERSLPGLGTLPGAGAGNPRSQTLGFGGLMWVPMGEVRSRLSDLDEHAEDKVVVMCHHGARSMQVTAFLRQQGFGDVSSMAGGIDLWSRDVDPAVPRY